MTDWLDPEQVRKWLNSDHGGLWTMPDARNLNAMEQFVRAQAKKLTHCEVTGIEGYESQCDDCKKSRCWVARIIVESLDEQGA